MKPGFRSIGAWLLVIAAGTLAVIAAKRIAGESALRTRASAVTVQVISSAVESGVPKIRFRYSVEGSEHESAQLAALAWRGDETAARELVERCPAGGGCLGFYDPQNPAVAFLDLRGFPIAGHAMLLVSVGLCTLALLGFAAKPKDLKPALVWIAGGVVVLFHYLVASDGFDAFLGGALAAVLAGGVALLGRTLR